MPIPAGAAAPGALLQRRVVTIGDVDQLTLGAVDDLGTKVYLNSLEGWDGAISTTLASVQRPNDDGAYISSPYLPARLLTANVQLVAATSDVLLQSLQLLAQRIPLRSPKPMVVTEGAQSLTAQVIQAGDLLATRKAHTATVSIALEAPDPRRYAVDEVVLTTGLPVTSGGLRLPFRLPARILATRAVGLIVATNDGNIETKPVFTVDGPCAPFTLTHQGTGRVLRYHEDVPAGRQVVIDTAARTALLDGAARYVTGGWFDYLPGVNEVSFEAYSYSPDASLTSVHRSAWK